MTDSPLLITTLPVSETPSGRPRPRVLCLTLLCHPDPARIGERSLLTPLLVREAVRLSRGDVQFARPGHETGKPLLDPYLSRNPVVISAGPELSVALAGLPANAQLDQQTISETCTLSAQDLERGVLLRLSQRILLLLHATAAEQPLAIDGMLGYSDVIERLRRQIARVAEHDTHVLIRGESGVGKERVAQALHARSRRAGRALVSVNMATLSEATAAATLFGYARGAFTGATARHHGLFERADGGTLFLDEVADTPQSVQPMLLRVLETGRVQPLGDEKERQVNVRVIAATEHDLDAGPYASSFRSALRHRLAGYEVVVPALRERLDDIPRLFVHFLRMELRELGIEHLLDSDASNPNPPLLAPLMSQLVQHPFPGNVRELANVARRLAVDALETGGFDLGAHTARIVSCAIDSLAISRDAMSVDTPGEAQEPPAIDEAALLEALERHAFSPLRTAAELGVKMGTSADVLDALAAPVGVLLRDRKAA